MKYLIMVMMICFLSGCGEVNKVINSFYYEKGMCLANDRWSVVYVIENVLDYGVMVTKIEREGVIRFVKLDKKEEGAYMTYRVLRDRWLERVDCVIIEKAKKK